ncbi:MAG: oligoendopeptidase F [Bacilli bacterium]|nr:oligoendopeptidase F [Bacilli bacterium]
MAKEQWDLSVFFKTEEEFLETLEQFKSLIPTLASYQGQLTDETKLAEFLRLDKKANLLLVRCYFFASMRSDRNKKDVANAQDLMKVHIAMQSYGSAVSFLSPELIAIGKDKLTDFLKRNPEFDEYSHQFDSLFLSVDHVLSAREEGLLSAFSPVTGGIRSLYSQLTTADGKPSKAKLSNGEEVTVTQANWTSLVAHQDKQEDRKAIFEALYSYYEDHKSTYGEIYNLTLQSQVANMRTRGYKSILESHLAGQAIPLDVFHTLIKTASEGSAPLKKYLEIRRKAFGLEKIRSYDRFLQLAKPKTKYTYDQARELFYDSIKNFPEDFQEKAREVTKDGYVDVHPGEGKRSGAYSNGGYDFHPFILLNFVGELDDVFTLAHESGHSIHTLYSEEGQPTLRQDYTIFVAEIASTFNEHNLLDYLLQRGDLDKDDKIFLLQKAIDEIVSTFYRQTLFGHYEYLIAEKAEKGEPINWQVCSNVMIDLYKQYYGIDISEEKVKPLVWAYIPHLFNSPFYVYQYATSFTSSMLLYAKVKAQEEGAFERYISLLKSGGSDFPVAQVKAAGVDLTTPEPYLAVVKRMSELVDQLEKLLAE